LSCTTEQATVLVKGYDYKGNNGRGITIDFCAVEEFVVGSCTGQLGFSDGTNTLLVTGGVASDNGDGTWKLQFDIDQADTTSLTAGRYAWQVSLIQGGEEILVGRSTNSREEIVWQDNIT
jgi:hypothetical protein